ncbi:alpha/beta hydrolase family protein [Mycolicibacterium brumae]|uniref:Alpha/beta hydrolase n=2 Tax=Mycolicibacterium brumae TaxID=85968 RepID=A0A2G5PE54_9MYCO|nr:alpha/beta hydrolase [Mycolicibacterium brumae]MCV7192725.1 alpha/beta hydrolase [Mycolicibacterium brumae]PIB76612.1 alpha/beta hydrolase [Mycolicibacterium brumae]
MSVSDLAQRFLVTVCALTKTTEAATHRLGPTPFLPRLFVDRFTHLGGISHETFRAQLEGCRSFEDAYWADYWETFANQQLAVADAALSRLGGPRASELIDGSAVDVGRLGELLAPAATILSERGPIADPDAVQRFCEANPAHKDAAVALDGLIKAMVYEFAAAWPGWSPLRLRAYERSHTLGEILLTALAPVMGVMIERVDIPFGGDDRVRGYLMIPDGVTNPPVVLITNGVEGSLAEAFLPLLKYRAEGLAMFVMEMPGTYSYREPLSPAAERVYTTVIDFLADESRLDGERIGMVGLSFGAYWATRMAAVDGRLKVAIANGAPTSRSFQPLGSIGLPEIMVSTLRNATGAKTMAGTVKRLAAMSLADYYSRIPIPLLVINGAEDTLVSTQDSIDIAIGAPQGQLVLYADDDHCAMGHSDEWMRLSQDFLRRHLLPVGDNPAARS